MTSQITKLLHQYTDQETARGREIFLEEYGNREEAELIWDRMNGGRVIYYWDAHVERLESEYHDHGGWEDH